MTSSALFGGSSSGPGSTGGNKHLVEMRAGKMNLKGKTVHPDTRKGLLFVYQSEDSLMHFCWQDRTTGIVEDDLIIFPDDCEYIKVPQCTTGRVFLLKFKSSNRKFFFWLQEPRIDKDEDHCKRINEYLNNPAGSVPSSGSNDPDLQSLLNNMSQSQLMQLFAGGQIGELSSLLGTISRPSTNSSSPSATTTPSSAPRSSTTTPALTHRFATPTTAASSATTPSSTPTATPSGNITGGTAASSTPATAAAAAAEARAAAGTGTAATAAAAGTRTVTEPAAAASGTVSNPIQLADLQSFLQGMTGVVGTGTGPATATAAATEPGQSVDLSTSLTGDALSCIFSDTKAVEQLQTHLPATDGSVEEQLRSTLQSPQFQQAVSQFSSALESGQLAPVVSQLVTNPDAVSAAKQGNMQDFLKALENGKEATAAAGASPKDDGGDKITPPPKKEESKKEEKEDDSMQLD